MSDLTGMFTVKYSPPFNARLAANSVVAAWLLPRLRQSPLWERAITEIELYQYIVEVNPNAQELFKLARIDDVVREYEQRLAPPVGE